MHSIESSNHFKEGFRIESEFRRLDYVDFTFKPRPGLDMCLCYVPGELGHGLERRVKAEVRTM